MEEDLRSSRFEVAVNKGVNCGSLATIARNASSNGTSSCGMMRQARHEHTYSSRDSTCCVLEWPESVSMKSRRR